MPKTKRPKCARCLVERSASALSAWVGPYGSGAWRVCDLCRAALLAEADPETRKLNSPEGVSLPDLGPMRVKLSDFGKRP